MKTSYNGLAVGNEELGAPMFKGDFITCPHCEAQHEVYLGKNMKTEEETNTLMFYKCPKTKKSYLCGIAGSNVMHKFN